MRPIFWRRRRERELDEEIRSHFRMAVEERVRRGEPREAAERAVRREFGNEVRVKEVTRTMWGGVWIDRLAQDLRLGVRSLVHHPRYSLAALGTLSLGITAGVTMFSVVETVLLRPLPYRSADRLILLETYRTSLDEIDGSSVPNVEDWEALSGSLESVTYFRRPRISHATLQGPAPRRLQEGLVGRGFFEVAGAAPVAGRTFSTDELRTGVRVAVLRQDLWEEHFGAGGFEPGRAVEVDGEEHVVVGVMPRSFQLPTRDTRLWRPLAVSAWWSQWSSSRETDGVVALGRLREGVGVEDARAEMSQVSARLRAAHPANADKDVRLTLLKDVLAVEREARRGLWMLFSAVSMLLVLGCANVAGLSAARGHSRRREMGIRTALGAARGSLVRQLLTEASLLAAVATAGGIVAAYFAVEAARRFGPADLPRFDQLSLSLSALAFALTAGAATILAFGIAPAMRASRVVPSSALRIGGHAAGQPTRLGEGLVAGQVMLATVLLVGGGLLLESFMRARAVDPGYASGNLVVASVELPTSSYPNDSDLLDYHSRARESLDTLPGVVASGSISHFFESAGSGTDPLGRTERLFVAEGGVVDWPRGAPPAFGGGGGGGVTPGYLEALAIPLMSGRYLRDGDLRFGPPTGPAGVEAIVINETMAETLWPGRDPLGRRLQFGRDVFDPGRFAYQVVGVVPDVRNGGLDVAAGPAFYISDVAPRMDIVVRTSARAAALLPSIRAALLDLDPTVPLTVSTASAELTDRLSLRRFQTGLISVFGIMALLLAAAGVYALLAYYVSTRTREIGIRRALGASRVATFTHVMKRCAAPVTVGLLVGLAGAAAGARVLEGLLFAVEPLDATAYLGATAVLVLTATVAAGLPALATTRIEPVEAVRTEA